MRISRMVVVMGMSLTMMGSMAMVSSCASEGTGGGGKEGAGGGNGVDKQVVTVGDYKKMYEVARSRGDLSTQLHTLTLLSMLDTANVAKYEDSLSGLYLTGRIPKGFEELNKKSLAKNPNNEEQRDMEISYLASTNPPEAIKRLKEEYARTSNAKNLVSLAQLYIQMRDIKSAETVSKQIDGLAADKKTARIEYQLKSTGTETTISVDLANLILKAQILASKPNPDINAIRSTLNKIIKEYPDFEDGKVLMGNFNEALKNPNGPMPRR